MNLLCCNLMRFAAISRQASTYGFKTILGKPCTLSTFNEIESKTNVVKDVILFKYENPKFFKYLNAFAMVQFIFWCFMGQFSISSMRDVPVPESVPDDLPWWKKINLGEGKYKHSLATVCYIFGTSILAASWIFTLRSVRYLILNKGGQKLSIITYAPFGETRILTVPLNVVSGKESRTSARSTLPLKVKNRFLHYMIDMRGEFRNAQLFDITAGVKRNL